MSTPIPADSSCDIVEIPDASCPRQVPTTVPLRISSISSLILLAFQTFPFPLAITSLLQSGFKATADDDSVRRRGLGEKSVSSASAMLKSER